MYINTVKKALKEGKVQLGTSYGMLRSAEVGKILAAAGFHWAFIDGEHGYYGLETTSDICRTATAAGLCPVARVADLRYDLVARSLDNGAPAIMFPRVENVALLETAVSWTKFPPLGVRGYGLTPHHVDYAKVTIPQIIDHMNEHVMVVLQIETKRAFDMRDELISVPGIDVVMIGPADFSISLGVPGDFMNPKLIEHMAAVRDTCLKYKVAPGTQTRNIQLARFWRENGMTFLGCSSEVGMMFDRGVEITSQLA